MRKITAVFFVFAAIIIVFNGCIPSKPPQQTQPASTQPAKAVSQTPQAPSSQAPAPMAAATEAAPPPVPEIGAKANVPPPPAPENVAKDTVPQETAAPAPAPQAVAPQPVMPQPVTPEPIAPQPVTIEPVTPQPAPVQEAPAPAAAPNAPVASQSHRMLRMDNANSNLQVNVIPMENTDGYYVRGSLGLNGTITRPKPDVDEWLFTGQFEFPSSGYKIERMYYSKLADVGIAQTSPPKESEKALTVITISIAAPRPGAPDVKEVTKTPISLNIKAEKTAQFMVMMGSSW